MTKKILKRNERTLDNNLISYNDIKVSNKVNTWENMKVLLL